MYYIEQSKIFDATNGGLDIILQYYPQAEKCIGNNRKFKLRDEKTPSSVLHKMPDGIWIIKDFGSSEKAKNAITITAEHENLSFGDAIKFLAKKLNILPDGINIELFKPEIEQRDAMPAEEDGKWYFKTENFNEKDIEVWYSKEIINANGGDVKILIDNLKKLHWHKLTSYCITKDRKTTIIKSTEHYPMYMLDEGTWKKLYFPKAEKADRFRSYGDKPTVFLHGLSQLEESFKKLETAYKTNLSSYESDPLGNNKPELPVNMIALEEYGNSLVRYKNVLICSGGSDAVNVSALGYNVVWYNSESQIIEHSDYTKLKKIAADIFYLGDIDDSGLQAAHKTCLRELEIRNVRLPESLKERTDWRGNACKDVKDYLQFNSKFHFDKLVQDALPYKFWRESYDARFKKKVYDCDNEALYNFLAASGFFQFENKDNNIDCFIQIEGNIVRQITDKHIRRYVFEFLKSRYTERELRNYFFRSDQLKQSSLSNLPYIKLDFTNSDKDTQWLFFKNAVWKVTAKGIEEYKQGKAKTYVWEKDVIQHHVKIQDIPFSIAKKEDDTWHAELKNINCLLSKFLWNTCKVHWRVEKEGIEENGKLRKEYLPEELAEHHQHFANKIFTLGYMFHRHKQDSKPWAVWAMDQKQPEDERESKGGSGKSIFISIPKHFMQVETENGRNPLMLKQSHVLENTTEYTGFVYIDDALKGMPFDYFFPHITSFFPVNPKGTNKFGIPFSKSPKIGFSSNFPPNSSDQSTLRRLLFTVFSDYYHHGPNKEFDSEFTPRSEFGKDLFTNFNDEDWNNAINLIARAIQFYLQHPDEKIQPPMDSVNTRQLVNAIGEEFLQWADVYFADENRLNCYIERLQVFEDMKAASANFMKNITSTKFKSKLDDWCDLRGHKLNPKHLLNEPKKKPVRIMQNIAGTTKEMFYIETYDDLVKLFTGKSNNESDNSNELEI